MKKPATRPEIMPDIPFTIIPITMLIKGTSIIKERILEKTAVLIYSKRGISIFACFKSIFMS